MVATLLKQGPLSATTAVREADFSPEQEREQKQEESANPEDFLPMFNPGGQDGGGDGKRGPKTKKEGSTSKRSGASSGGAE
jgi:hypothetical protein